MADCECISACPYFHDKLAGRPALAELVKRRLCRGDFSQCARYRVFKVHGRGNVPIDLYPDDTDRADQILARG